MSKQKSSPEIITRLFSDPRLIKKGINPDSQRYWASIYATEVIEHYKCPVTDKDNNLATEFLSEWLISDGHFKKWCEAIDSFSVERVATESDNAYNIKTDSHFDAFNKALESTSTDEVLYAKRLFARSKADPESFPVIGSIINFEIPLSDNSASKNKVEPIADSIDLVSVSGNTILLLELKQANNDNETLLRCLMESFTYYHLIKNKATFINDFVTDTGNKPTGIDPQTADISICPFVPRASRAGKQLQEYLDNNRQYKWLHRLVDIMSQDIKSEVRFSFTD